MFVIKYDKVSMIKLVRSIEKNPEIYNTKKLYSKDEQDAAWDRVAIEVGEKDSLCRDRWHSIKSCYVRHLKYTALNTRRRPYYLAEYLNFMAPHFSDKVKKFLKLKNLEIANLPTYLREALPPEQHYLKDKKQISVVSQPAVNIKEEVVDVEDDSCEGWLDISVDNQQPSSSATVEQSCIANVFGSAIKTEVDDDDDRDVDRDADDSDKDVMFFKSLLPEVARMSSHQKLKFKQEALSTIEDILYATDYANVTE